MANSCRISKAKNKRILTVGHTTDLSEFFVQGKYKIGWMSQVVGFLRFQISLYYNAFVDNFSESFRIERDLGYFIQE